MNRFIMILTAAALFGAPPAAVAAQPLPDPGRGNNAATFDFCRYLMTLEAFATMNLGECLSYNNVSDPGFVPHNCDALREFGLLDDFGFESYSDCIRDN